jgi:hypothetical protein
MMAVIFLAGVVACLNGNVALMTVAAEDVGHNSTMKNHEESGMLVSSFSRSERVDPVDDAITNMIPRPLHKQGGIFDLLADASSARKLSELSAATLAALPWVDQPETDHDADVARAWRTRTTANRRHLQGAGADEDAIEQLMPGPMEWCDDSVATNVGQAGRCMYDCQLLQRHYFPDKVSSCFLYNDVAGAWPAALLSRKQALSDSTNTIVVPNDENWIIQGALGPDNVPVKLDARISSGSAVDFSEASIVLRHVRFYALSAPIDLDTEARDYNQLTLSNPYFAGGETRLGGAFFYEGGGLDPDVHTPELRFATAPSSPFETLNPDFENLVIIKLST